MTLKLNQNIAISDTGFLFNPATGESFTINPTGARFISLLKEGLEDQAIISKMCDEFEVEARDLERDLLDFMEMLKHNHLLVEDE